VIETAAIVFSSRGWLWPAAAAVIILAAALVWSGRRSATNRRVRLGCGLLKFIGVITLALCLLDPLRVGQRARPGANVFAVIADNSEGLQIKDAGAAKSRGEILRENLTRPDGWQSALAENFQVRRYEFDSRLQNVPNFAELNFDGRASSLMTALRTATERWRGQPVAGVLLFTDGNATDFSGEIPALEGSPPIYPVVVGSDDELRDLSIKKVGVSQTSFEDAPVTIQAQVAQSGFDGSEISARLTEIATGANRGTNSAVDNFRISTSSNIVAQSTQRAGKSGDLNFRFQIQPSKPGLHFYQLETRASDDAKSKTSSEATLANNRQMIVVDRGQEPFRVLYVSGRPNWEYKFLNRAIQDDPQVQMVSLIRVARREPKFQFKGRAGESSNPLFRGFGHNDEETARYDQPVLVRLNTKDEMELRGGFPKTAEELFQYSAVILDDVEAEFFTHDQMALMQRFVSERGGGFLMLGGTESFREGDYAGTLVGSMLPVYLDRETSARLPSKFKLTLTRDGWLQPWTRLRRTEAEETARLAAMPEFDILNPTREIKPGASVLATVSDENGQTFPALAVQRFGFGRVGALMIGDLWLWGMRDAETQKDLGKSWRQLVRWLVSDVPKQISVQAKSSGDPDEIRLTIKAHDKTFQPLDNATVRLKIRSVAHSPRNNSTSQMISETNSVQLTAEPMLNDPGTYEATFIARNTGAYSAEATVTKSDGTIAGRAATGWASDPAAAEFRSLAPNRLLLETIARKTGGEIVSMNDLEKFVHHLPEHRAPITEPWSDPLWNKPLVFLFVIGCFVAEWGIRRWKGLP
jgi:uncharacterized membrane protein